MEVCITTIFIQTSKKIEMLFTYNISRHNPRTTTMATKFDTYIINGGRYVKYDDHKSLEKIASDRHASSTKMLRDELKQWKKYYDAKVAELNAIEKKYNALRVAHFELQEKHNAASDEEDVINVTTFKFRGKDYLKDKKNTVYAFDTHKQVGKWCETTHKIYICESDDESDEDVEVVSLSKVD